MNTKKLALWLLACTSMSTPLLLQAMNTNEDLTEEEQLALGIAMTLSLQESVATKKDPDLEKALALSLKEKPRKKEKDTDLEKAINESKRAFVEDRDYALAVHASKQEAKNKLEQEKSKHTKAAGFIEPDYNMALKKALDNKNFATAKELVNFAHNNLQILTVALMEAIHQDQPQAINLINLLVSLPTIPAKVFNEALAHASHIGSDILVKLLVDQATDYAPSLFRAAKKNHEKIVSILIPRVQKSIAAQILLRALLEASNEGGESLIKELIALGAAQLTLEYLAQYNYPELIDLLLEHVTSFDKALEIAKEKNQHAVKQKLQKAKDEKAGTYEEPICAICLDEKTDMQIKGCGHEFHQACLNDWFKKEKTCPTCRKAIN